MKFRILTGLAIGLMADLPTFAGEQHVSIDVSDKTCPSCSFTVASSMRSVPTVDILGFQESSVFGEGVFTVSSHDESASPEMILQAIIANGYPAVLHQAENS